MFKLDEAVVNEQFGYMLDVMSPYIASRSATFPIIRQLALLRLPSLKLLPLLGYEEAEIGLKTIFTHELLKRGSEDFIKLVTQQLVDAMICGVIEQRRLIGHPLAVGPLMFEYDEGEVEVGDRLMPGIEVVTIALMEWGLLRCAKRTRS